MRVYWRASFCLAHRLRTSKKKTMTGTISEQYVRYESCSYENLTHSLDGQGLHVGASVKMGAKYVFVSGKKVYSIQKSGLRNSCNNMPAMVSHRPGTSTADSVTVSNIVLIPKPANTY